MRSTLPLALLAVLSIAACSKSAGNTAVSNTTTTTTTVSAPAGTACDRKLITTADVAPLFNEAVSGEKTLPGDAQSCEFNTVNDSLVQIALRPGLGDATVAQVRSGKTNQPVTPLPGVGDTAVWDPVLKEVDATKNNVLCVIGVEGPASTGATPDKVGALCNKIFAGI